MPTTTPHSLAQLDALFAGFDFDAGPVEAQVEAEANASDHRVAATTTARGLLGESTGETVEPLDWAGDPDLCAAAGAITR